MRFKKGSKVEVFSKQEVPTGSWLCAEIISGNGHTYSVRYGCLTMAGEVLVGRVPRKSMRPCPPPLDGADNWVTGDHVEVFQNMSWKTATVMKVLDGNNFSIRLLGESLEFRAHRSRLRVRQSWEDDKWAMVGKDVARCTMSLKNNQTHTNTKLYVREGYFQAEKNMGVEEPHISTSRKKRALEAYDVASVQKARAIGKDSCRKPVFGGKVETYISLREKLGGKSLQTSCHSSLAGAFRPVDAHSTASSVGSCSVNGNIHYRVKHENTDTKSFCSDAESFCGRRYEEEGCSLSQNEQLVEKDHRLELNAYRETMKGLYASGLLSWEDEMKVTDMRRALHISLDEHLVEVRKLIAAGTSTTIPIS